MLPSAFLILLFGALKALRARAWAASPGNTCIQCCCCAVTAAGTRNFCPNYVSGGYVVGLTNCFYLETHLDDVLAYLNSEYGSILDTYSMPGTRIYWSPTDPAYGCFKDLETVTPTRVAMGPAPTWTTPGLTIATANNNVGSGGCVFNGGNVSGVVCGNNTNNAQGPQTLRSQVAKMDVNYGVFIGCIALVVGVLFMVSDLSDG